MYSIIRKNVNIYVPFALDLVTLGAGFFFFRTGAPSGPSGSSSALRFVPPPFLLVVISNNLAFLFAFASSIARIFLQVSGI